jgi:hypothetical protein
MDKETKKMRNLIHLMRKNGVLSLKMPQIELILTHEAFQIDQIKAKSNTSGDETNKSSTPLTSSFHNMTLEELALYSAPGYQPDPSQPQ